MCVLAAAAAAAVSTPESLCHLGTVGQSGHKVQLHQIPGLCVQNVKWHQQPCPSLPGQQALLPPD
jgi:hypothetical protein